jgi:hypothetical protein
VRPVVGRGNPILTLEQHRQVQFGSCSVFCSSEQIVFQ